MAVKRPFGDGSRPIVQSRMNGKIGYIEAELAWTRKPIQ
jgi:hypothetical protein